MHFAKHVVSNFCNEYCTSIQFRLNGPFQKKEYYPGVFIWIISNIICVPSQKLKKCYNHMKRYIMFHCRITLIKVLPKLEIFFISFVALLWKDTYCNSVTQFTCQYELCVCAHVWISARVNIICAFTLGCSIFGNPVCQFNFLFVISGFRRDDNEICGLLKSNAA